jgi:hypothetical protein
MAYFRIAKWIYIPIDTYVDEKTHHTSSNATH